MPKPFPRAVEVPAETLLLAAGVFFAAASNGPFLRLAQQDGGLATSALAALFAALVALHVLVAGLLTPRPLLRPVLALLVVAAAFAGWYAERYRVVLDPSMMRNVLRTQWHEARELLNLALLPHLLLHAALPLAVLALLRPAPRPWRRALLWRGGTLVLAALALVGAVMVAFQPLASLMRNHREARYLVTPSNVLWSTAQALRDDARQAARPRQAIGEDAAPGPRMAARTRALRLVLVVGETARAADWGLNAGAPPTTPQLARLDPVNFTDVTACGTNTEVSLPCMFAPVGRHDYDEARIRGQESLLHVLARAGVGVQWRDNQSGCKGVCEGLPSQHVAEDAPPALCPGGACLDEALLQGLPAWLQGGADTRVLVLHMLGNHGPAYFRRYPPAFERFTPACRNDDLRRCSAEEIHNAYQNALLYTDHVLATLVRTLAAAAGEVDSAMLYVSDHGESLGEHGLFLHGVPYAIAPDVQKKVPMVAWLSAGFPAAAGIDAGCLRARAARPASHDHLFHTVLSLLDVRTALHDPAWDLTTGCVAR